ncbi:hypothetical protein GF386_00885, partial [Candidatus Pacearchaeota archaeon]|nr:hypothetical protein [Candidatus Pacearchaeota archaeon]
MSITSKFSNYWNSNPMFRSVFIPTTGSSVMPVKKPLINEPYVFSHPNRVVNTPVMDVKRPVPSILWNYCLSTPEVYQPIQAIIEDILSDGWRIVGTRNKKLRAERFLERNKFKQALESFLWDMLVTGDGYIYIPSV